jgi:hypothetical protein
VLDVDIVSLSTLGTPLFRIRRLRSRKLAG